MDGDGTSGWWLCLGCDHISPISSLSNFHITGPTPDQHKVGEECGVRQER